MISSTITRVSLIHRVLWTCGAGVNALQLPILCSPPLHVFAVSAARAKFKINLMTNNIMAFSVAARLDAAGADLTAMAGEIGAISSRVDALNVKVGAAADGGRNVASSASGGGGRGRKKEKGNKKAITERGDRSGAGITAGALETLKPADPILMHVVVRADLVSGLGWPVGSVITQACHVSQ